MHINFIECTFKLFLLRRDVFSMKPFQDRNDLKFYCIKTTSFNIKLYRHVIKSHILYILGEIYVSQWMLKKTVHKSTKLQTFVKYVKKYKLF